MRGCGADPSFRGRPGPRFTGATETETETGAGAGAGAGRTTFDDVRELLRERSVDLEASLSSSTFEGRSSSESSDTLVRVESLAPKRSSSQIGTLANGGISFWSFWSFWGALRVRSISGSLVGRSSWAWVSSSSSASSLSEPTHGISGTEGCSCT